MTFVFYVLCVLSVGTLPLLCKWYGWIRLYLTHLKSSYGDATSILVRSELSGAKDVCPVKLVRPHAFGRDYV
jgi:hypothetical protein